MSKIQKSNFHDNQLDQTTKKTTKPNKTNYQPKISIKDHKNKNQNNKNVNKNNKSTLKDSLAEIDIPPIINIKNYLQINAIHKISIPTILAINKPNECTKDTQKFANDNDSGFNCNNCNNNNIIQDDKTSSDIIEYNSSESVISKINLDLLNKIKIIYEEMKLIFSNNCNNENNNNNYIKAKFYAFDYFQFLFSDEIKYIIRLFNYSLEVGEFIITQIFLFSQILYIDENNNLDDLQLSYKTVFLYSLQNFDFLINIIYNSTFISEPKKMKIMKNKNKIIISILKSFSSNNELNNNITNIVNNNLNLIGGFPYKCFQELLKINKPNTNFKTLISEYNLNINSNKNNNKSIGIINLLSLLNSNKELKNKLLQIQQKSQNIPEFSDNNSRNNHNFYNFICLNNEQLLKKYENQKVEFQIITPIENNNEKNNFQYHLIIELDETLIHYCEEGSNYYVKVRYGVENFFKVTKNFFEIIVLSTSGKEYTDIIINNMNKDKDFIQGIIYTENFNELDLTKINRNINKCIFICHDNNFFNAPIKNIIQLREFNGDENDREFVFLQNEISKIKNIKNVTDVSYLITEMKLGINHARKINMK